jgi:hypothetical protein
MAGHEVWIIREMFNDPDKGLFVPLLRLWGGGALRAAGRATFARCQPASATHRVRWTPRPSISHSITSPGRR